MDKSVKDKKTYENFEIDLKDKVTFTTEHQQPSQYGKFRGVSYFGVDTDFDLCKTFGLYLPKFQNMKEEKKSHPVMRVVTDEKTGQEKWENTCCPWNLMSQVQGLWVRSTSTGALVQPFLTRSALWYKHGEQCTNKTCDKKMFSLQYLAYATVNMHMVEKYIINNNDRIKSSDFATEGINNEGTPLIPHEYVGSDSESDDDTEPMCTSETFYYWGQREEFLGL